MQILETYVGLCATRGSEVDKRDHMDRAAKCDPAFSVPREWRRPLPGTPPEYHNRASDVANSPTPSHPTVTNYRGDMVRTLILMRHGKSGYPPGVDDHERPLAERGLREAALAGEWLRATRPPIDAVRCSTATRTRQTLAATGVTAPVVYEPGIYEAAPSTLVELVRLCDEDVSTLLVVGHAPGMPRTAWELAGNRDDDAAIELGRKFPTSALAVLTFDRPWEQIGEGTGELVAFHVPR